MIDTEALRKKAIDLAIKGKLTEQLPSDGDAETLYAQILKQKSQLIKEGKIKRDKELPDISSDEIPFEVPDNWKWCRLGEIYSVMMGQSPDGMNVGTDIEGIEFHQGKIYFGEKYLMKSELKTSELTRIAEENSVLLCVRAPVGVVNITERKICIGRGLCALTVLADMEPYYLFYYLLSCRKSFENSGTGSTFSSITVDVVKKHLIPIPPLAEQKRIVEILDNVFTQFAIIDNLQEKYSNDIAALKNKIIDAGIQGKLTEQLPEDGDAETLYAQILKQKSQLIKEGKIKKDKELPDISSDEIPFEVPDNWKWCRLGEIYSVMMGQSPDGMNVGTDIEGIEFHQGKIYFGEKYLMKSELKTSELTRIAEENSVLLCVRAPVGVVNITERKICIGRGLCALTVLADMEPYYLFYYLLSCRKSFENSGTGSTFSSITVDVVKKHLIPIPPLAEQKRIVSKIDAILEQLNF